MAEPVFITEVVLRNYKSIAKCAVPLGPLTFLVGPNGAGKSNFLDALRLVAESLNMSLESALRERGGIYEVRRRSAGHPTHFAIKLTFSLPDGRSGRYGFQVGAARNAGFVVQEEVCEIESSGSAPGASFRVSNGKVRASSERIMPPAQEDRLFLGAAAGLPPFRGLFDALSHMGFYNFNPDEIRELQPPDAGKILKRDGSNLASILNIMEKENRDSYSQVVAFLSKVVPGVVGVNAKQYGKKETLEFRQHVVSDGAPWRFMAENMSDGTLRALGVLTSLFQTVNGESKRIPLVGIEEPEIAVHPGAAGILRDALRVASASTQVIVTSHSPDLLDDKEILPDCILGVTSINGRTIIGPLDETGKSSIRDRLFTAGELLRQSQLLPIVEAVNPDEEDQLDLFPEKSD
jgi:predicted ATPase